MARYDETELTLLNDRNIHALHDALKREQVRVDILVERLETVNRQIAGLHSEIENMRQSLIAMITQGLRNNGD